MPKGQGWTQKAKDQMQNTREENKVLRDKAEKELKEQEKKGK